MSVYHFQVDKLYCAEDAIMAATQELTTESLEIVMKRKCGFLQVIGTRRLLQLFSILFRFSDG